MVASSFKTRLTDLIKECFELTTEKQLRIVDDILQLLDNEASVKPQFILGADKQQITDVTTSSSSDSKVEASVAASAVPTSTTSIEKPAASPLTLQANESEHARVVDEVVRGGKSHRRLEEQFPPNEAVVVRRRCIERLGNVDLAGVPCAGYNYKEVNGACCENIIGYTPVPVGVAGPLKVDGDVMHVPMATTEGALVASTNRGCKALLTNGVTTAIVKDAMTRAPVLRFDNIGAVVTCAQWLKNFDNYELIKMAFESTSRFCKLQEIMTSFDGNDLHLRFVASTGDAMGMNMVTKATQAAINYLKTFHKFEALSLSGNMCTDKKAAAINWICGRGRSTVAQAVVPASIVKSVLKSDVDSLVRLADAKCNRGSANAVTIGGANAQAANVVAAVFIATGQDAAQVVSSSMCSTHVEQTIDGDLLMTCTMNCLELGTVGGGTILEPQRAALKMLGCAGASVGEPGDNARRLARIVCATVLAGELSLLSSQCADDLVRSHMRLNRSSRDVAAAAPTTSSTSAPTTANGRHIRVPRILPPRTSTSVADLMSVTKPIDKQSSA